MLFSLDPSSDGTAAPFQMRLDIILELKGDIRSRPTPALVGAHCLITRPVRLVIVRPKVAGRRKPFNIRQPGLVAPVLVTGQGWKGSADYKTSDTTHNLTSVPFSSTPDSHPS